MEYQPTKDRLLFGYAKRDLLVKKVVAAKNSQEEAKQQFKSSLEKLSALVNFNGGTLENKYLETKTEYENSMLYLKHNLNAEAVASIKDELTIIRADITSLINDMNVSIAEADKFVNSLS